MNIEFCRLSEIKLTDIVELNTNKQVLKQMPLGSDRFNIEECISWVNAKESLWTLYGYGPWGFLVDGHFAGWGGLQYEEGDADLALVLHPKYWGLGKRIFDRILHHAFSQMGLDSITILLPPTRTKLQAIYSLGFELEKEVVINNVSFIKYRLKKMRHLTVGFIKKT